MQMFDQQIWIQGISYTICGTIGEGGAAAVYLARGQDNKSYALKKVHNYNNPMIKQLTDDEIKIQKSFKGNDYVIQYVGVEKTKNQVYIVLELGEYSLRNAIEMRQVTQQELISMMCDVSNGLHAIHHSKVIHRDIKPENIIFKNGIFKITDFGVSVDREQDESVTGTILYWAPEMLFESQEMFTNKIDVWSLGVTAFECYFKVNPFCLRNNLSQSEAVKEIKANIKELTPDFTLEKFMNLLQRKNMTKQLAYIQKRLKRTREEVINSLCSLLEPKPTDRFSIDVVLGIFNNLLDNKVGEVQSRKTKLNPKKKSVIPDDIKMFCRAKDLFYGANAQIKSPNYENTLFGFEIAIWYLQGANYGGINFVYLDKIDLIKDYDKPKDQLWADVRKRLSSYYYELIGDSEAEEYKDIKELRISVIICSAWIKILNCSKFCKNVSKIIGIEIVSPVELFDYLSLISEKKIRELEEMMISLYLFI